MEYELELSSRHHGWWRYNIYMSLVGYDDSRHRVDFAGLNDHVGDIWAQNDTQTQGMYKERQARVKCGPCATAAGYVYVIANTLPVSSKVADSPDFEVELVARADGREIFRKIYMVNPWGGLAVAGLELDASK